MVLVWLSEVASTSMPLLSEEDLMATDVIRGVDGFITGGGRAGGGGVDVSTVGGRAVGSVGVVVSSGVDVAATAVGGVGVDVESWRWCWYTWPTPVLLMLSPALLLSLKLLLWVVFPCSNATASPATAGGKVPLGSTPSESSTAGSGGRGKEANWFQAAAASVDVSDIDSARTLTAAWKR